MLRYLEKKATTSVDVDEDMIAADLNLYSNPLTKALSRRSGKGKKTPNNPPTATTSPQQGGKKPPLKTKKSLSTGAMIRQQSLDSGSITRDEIANATEEIIALDLNKYDSPLKDLE